MVNLTIPNSYLLSCCHSWETRSNFMALQLCDLSCILWTQCWYTIKCSAETPVFLETSCLDCQQQSNRRAKSPFANDSFRSSWYAITNVGQMSQCHKTIKACRCCNTHTENPPPRWGFLYSYHSWPLIGSHYICHNVSSHFIEWHRLPTCWPDF